MLISRNRIRLFALAALSLSVVAGLANTSRATIVIGDPNNSVVDIVYNYSLGDISFNTKGPSLTGFVLDSASSSLIPANANLGPNGGFLVASPSELSNTQFSSANYYPNGYDLGHVLPLGLTAATLTQDLTFHYGIPAGGVQVGALEIVPEPSSCVLLGLAGSALALMVARRRRAAAC